MFKLFGIVWNFKPVLGMMWAMIGMYLILWPFGWPVVSLNTILIHLLFTVIYVGSGDSISDWLTK